MPEPTTASTLQRILVVADWTVDPYAVVAACRRRAAHQPVPISLVVPAWLHGLDWAGDPGASLPCACRQVEKLSDLLRRAGLEVERAEVGDPNVVAATTDALGECDAGEVMLFERRRRFGHGFDVAHRVRRASGRPVTAIQVPPSAGPRPRRGWTLLRGAGHCEPDALRAA
jgi:hypothetical protein